MRKLISIIILFTISIFGQGIKISQLPNTSVLGNSDLLLVVNDSSGTLITKNIYVSSFSTALAGKLTTSNIAEGSNLYYTDQRAIAALTGNNNTWTGSNTFNGAITDNGVSIDTIASRNWVYSTFPTTSNFMDLSSTQTVSGNKSFTGTLTTYSRVSTPQTYSPATDITTFALSPARNLMVITPPATGISGLISISNGSDGFDLTIINPISSGNNMVIKHNAPGGNILTKTGVDVTVTPGQTITFVYYQGYWYEK